MPLRTQQGAPHFTGDSRQLVHFLESVDRLAQYNSLSDKDCIKFALRYMEPDERELLSYCEFDNYNVVLTTIRALSSKKPAAIEAPLASAPPQTEHTQEQPAAKAIAPISESQKHPLTSPAPPSVQLEARIISAPQEPISAPEYPSAEDIPPKLEVCKPITIPNLPEVPLEEIIPLAVRDDFKHLLHLNAPYPEPSEVSEVHYVPLSDQVMSLETQLVADHSALVQYPCVIPPTVSDDFKHLSVVRDDFKHPLHISAPIPEPSEAPEANNTLLSNQVMSLETPLVADTSALVTFYAHSDHPQVHYPCTIPPSVSDDFKTSITSVRDDSKHPSHPNAPIPEPSVATEVQNAPLSDQSMSLVTPLITDNSAPFAFSAYSDFHLPVKHPCITSPIRQLDHVSDDSDAPPVRRHMPKVAQVMHPEAFSQGAICHLQMFRLYLCTSSLLIRHSCAAFVLPRALFPVLYAPIIAEESSCYCTFTISSVLSRISLVQNQSHFNSMFMRNLCAHLAYIHTPFAFIIVYDFASFTFIRIFCSSTYGIDIIVACPIKGHPFMSWRQLALDLESIRHSCALSAPNTAYHSPRVNIFTVYQPLLTYSEDIDSNAPKHDCACSSRAHYLTIEHHHAPYIAPLGCAFNLYRKVQEFIPPEKMSQSQKMKIPPPLVAFHHRPTHFSTRSIAHPQIDEEHQECTGRRRSRRAQRRRSKRASFRPIHSIIRPSPSLSTPSAFPTPPFRKYRIPPNIPSFS
ncbi:hypothetical protein DFJ58DRAFT_722052 [Suillus subalutaceus]|uniref:uncharacterized protein n=1 Tax=Suillus subalutaceus TaxID=48586 RepID=UPI001B885305|nr:uncharacterized protein DFJ58DRAFT_722052 [Suillus subalutaceus]KAG1872892.1 hypothetical protein DFJ58DRAFT_722052 [Suillus subalutaceus]